MSDIYEDDDESDDSKFFPVSVNGETKDEAEQAVASCIPSFRPGRRFV